MKREKANRIFLLGIVFVLSWSVCAFASTTTYRGNVAANSTETIYHDTVEANGEYITFELDWNRNQLTFEVVSDPTGGGQYTSSAPKPIIYTTNWIGGTWTLAVVNNTQSSVRYTLDVTETQATAGECDLIVTDIWTDPASVAEGEMTNFICRVENQGSAASPSDTDIGVAFFVDGTYETWGSVSGPLDSGASIDVTTDGNGGPWIATSGSHIVKAEVDDQKLIAESDETNNIYEEPFEVTEKTTEQKAFQFLYNMMDRYVTSGMRAVESFVEPDDLPPYGDGENDIAWTYDNTLTIIAFEQNGDWDRAKDILDAFIWYQNNDPDFADGRIRDGYHASAMGKDIRERRYVRHVAWYSSPGTMVGNVSFMMIAALRYHEHLGVATSDYLTFAKRLGDWIAVNTYSTIGPGGFTGGKGGWEPNQGDFAWKSTEHNIDAYVAFMKLYEATGDSSYHDYGMRAKNFVQAMWDPLEGKFWIGTLDDGETINQDDEPADVNTWGLMALGELSQYGAAITWVENNCAVYCDGYNGFDYGTDRDGVWFEGTAHTAIGFKIKGEHTKADYYLNTLLSTQADHPNADGYGIVSACHYGVTTLFGGFLLDYLHTGATAWFTFTINSYNPFWGVQTSDLIPYDGVYE